MKNLDQKKHSTDLASNLINKKESISDETAEEKAVIADECGDTLWDDILKQKERNSLPKNNERK
jgi:hypothetical protein